MSTRHTDAATRYVVELLDDALRVVDGGRAITLTPTQLRIVEALAAGPAARSVGDLVDAVWMGRPPASAAASLHNQLSRLRQRAPELVIRQQDLYQLGPAVRVQATGPEIDSVEDPVARARAAVEADPHDERACADLVIALATAGRRADAMNAIDRLQRDLADVGLEAGRRITDLARLVADGERRADRLVGTADAPVDLGLTLGAFALDELIGTTREWLRNSRDGLLAIAGAAGSGRSHALRVVRELAAGTGFEAMEIRCGARSRLPVLPIGRWSDRHPRLLLLDDADLASDATRRLVERLVADTTTAPLAVVVTVGDEAAPGSWTVDELVASFDREVTTARTTLASWGPAERASLLDRLGFEGAELTSLLETLGGLDTGDGLTARVTLDAIRLATGSTADRREFDRIVATRSVVSTVEGGLERAFVTAMVDQLDESARRLLDVLSLTVTPAIVDDLAPLVPDLRGQLRRREVRRLLYVDDLHGRVRTRDRAVNDSLVAAMSPRRRVELHAELAASPYEREAPHLRARRRATHGAEADLTAVEAARAMEDLAAAVTAAGDRLTAADISRVAADTVFAADARQYCELSIRAGTELLRAGDPVALNSIRQALDVAVANELTSLAAQATWVYCGLGPTSGAGQIDGDAAAMIERVEPMVDTDADRARVLTAWAMVHTLAGDSIRCAETYDRAEFHARRAGDEQLLIETLPCAYMALSAPSHLERREAIAAELHDIAARTETVASEWEALHLDFSNELQRGDPALRDTLGTLRTATAQLDGAQHDWETVYLGAVVAQIDGELGEALRLAEASLGAGGAVGDSRRMAIYGAILLGNHLAEGTVDELYPFLEQMIAEQPLLAAWRAPFALAAAARGEYELALEQLGWLAEPGAIEADCTQSAVVAVAGGAAADVCSALDADHPRAPEATRLAERFIELLTPWTGRWSWYGAGTYGPIDTTLARVHHSLGDTARSIEFASAAAAQSARMRAPIHSRAAAALLLDQPLT